MEAIVAGYIALAIAYMALMMVVSTLGRKVLMDGDCVSRTYTVLLSAVWFAASAVGAYVCCGLSPLAPYGTIGIPLMLCGVSGYVVARNMVQMPGQQSIVATGSVFVMILAGTVGGLYLRHAFVY